MAEAAIQVIQKSGGTRADERSDAVARALLPVSLFTVLVIVLLGSSLLSPSSALSILKVALIALLAVFPAWLYDLFLWRRGPSLYDEYVLNLFRMHIDEYRNLPMPPRHTSYYPLWRAHHDELRQLASTQTKDNLYRRKFEAVFGRRSVSTRSQLDRLPTREQVGAMSPVIVATLVFALGWAVVLRPELLGGMDLLGGRPFSNEPTIRASAINFGFLGAYVFITSDIVRRYFRDDIKAAAFVSAILRIITVVIMVHVVSLLPMFDGETVGSRADEMLDIVAFGLGFFPLRGLQLLRAATVPVARRLFPAKPRHGLDQLDGMTLWYESRFFEEGVDDLQTLTTASLVELMLRVRVPVQRLSDWIDQAVLLLHLGHDKTLIKKLRGLGIRSACDLQDAWGSQRHRERRAVIAASFESGGGAVETVLASMEGNANLWHVAQFRKHSWLLADAERKLQNDTRLAA
jgi:hypothetical protein